MMKLVVAVVAAEVELGFELQLLFSAGLWLLELEPAVVVLLVPVVVRSLRSL